MVYLSTDHLKNLSIFKFERVRLGVRVLGFHNYGKLGGQLRTRNDDAIGDQQKGDLYHKYPTCSKKAQTCYLVNLQS